MSAELVVHDLDGFAVPQRRADHYVNATALCKAAGKLWADYWRRDSTQAFLAELAAVMAIPITGLAQVRQGGEPGEQGTWVHPDVAVHLAQWCSPHFAVQVSRWVRELMTTGRVELAPQPDPSLALREVLALVAEVRADMKEQRAEIAALKDQRAAQPVTTSAVLKAHRSETEEKVRTFEAWLRDPKRPDAFAEEYREVRWSGGLERGLADKFDLSKAAIGHILGRCGYQATRKGYFKRIIPTNRRGPWRSRGLDLPPVPPAE